jgi:hypothetical protein
VISEDETCLAPTRTASTPEHRCLFLSPLPKGEG